ncbi:TcfC E-set like domain-containing protein [Stenotrophomonas sp. TWI143]|uniref:TcfC E-set like domain-containing protein n=1 Tax=Stenotrophomonas sp. TWI143 TaxID=3136771 RepID=UPI00320B94B1
MLIPAPAHSRLAVALALTLATPTLPAVHARPVPAGFEDLASGQTERVEVRLFGQSAGLWSAWVTLDTVQLDQPAQVLEALGLSADARDALQAALAAPLPRNSHLACPYGQPDPGCGWIDSPDDPAQVHAIFDESDGVLMLFPARRWLPQQSAQRSPFHQVSEQAQNALLQQQTVNFSGGDGYQALSVQGSTVLGVLRDGHVASSWNYSRQARQGYRAHDRFQMDDLYYRHDLAQRHYVQLGRMDRRNLSSQQGGTFGFGMLPLDRFEGLRVGTTQAYVDTDANVTSTPLTVLLGRDARVDAFDGDRLLQTFYLQAGVNDLDTRRFPLGSYTVTLRIYEDGRFVRSEEAPFSRGGDWSERSLQWFVQGGRRRAHATRASDIGDASDTAVQAGLRIPLARNYGMTAGIARVGDTGYGELRLEGRQQFGRHDLQAMVGVLSGGDGSHGLQQQLSYRHYASWNVYRQRLRGGACQSSTPVQHDRFGCVDALSASVSAPLFGGSLYLGYTRRRSFTPEWSLPGEDDDAWTGLPPGLLPPHVPALRPAQTSRSLQASYSRTRQWRGLSIGSRLGVWQQDTDTGSGRGPARDRGLYLNIAVSRLQRIDDGSVQQRVALDMRQPQHSRPDARLGLSHSLRQERDGDARDLGAELSAYNDDRYSALASARIDNCFGQSGASVSYYQHHGGGELAYSGNHTSGLSLSARGLHWGGAHGADAGVVVSVDDARDLELSGAAADIRAGSNRRRILGFGERRLLPLGGYQRHRVDVQDASAHDSDAAVRVARLGAAQHAFLLPGKVIALPVTLDVTYTFIGNARDIAGTPLEGARILNAPVPSLGRDGGFIAEFPQREPVLYLLRAGDLLQCPLTVRERRSVVLLVGQVQCEPLALEQLPAPIRHQARVQRLLNELAPVAGRNERNVMSGGAR